VDNAGYVRSTNLITVTLQDLRYDVDPGTRIKLTIQTGLLNGVHPGTVVSTSTSGTTQTIIFTPDNPPANSDINPYSTPTNSSTNSFVSPATAISLSVDTEDRPVNLIIRGDVGTSAPADYVTLKHLVKDSPAQNFVHKDVNVRILWNRLRIFGRMGVTGACRSNLAQSFYIRPDPVGNVNTTGESSSLGGAFLWLPRGHLFYGTTGLSNSPGNNNPIYPRELLTVWWLCNLSVTGLTTSMDRMVLITPLAGNPDAVGGLLPGGFTSSADVFTPDLRFPVYPSLQRIRSAY
jgi:hypothetical protein